MEFFLTPGMGPFTFFAVLVLAFLALEIVFMMIGLDTRFSDVEPGGAELTTAPTDIPDGIDLPDGVELDAEVTDTQPATSTGGLLDILGLRRVPLTVWLALFSALFAGVGIFGQSLITLVFGAMMPAKIAAVLALLPALALTRLFAEAVGNLMPQMETTAISERSFGRRRGIITVGTARRGHPAEVRFTDAHGNLHYLMLEPLADDAEIGAGSEVLIIRVRATDDHRLIHRLIPLS